MTEAKNNVISLERTGARTILPSSPSQDFSISRLHPPKRTKKMCVSCVCEGEDTLNKGQAKGKMVLAPVRSREITIQFPIHPIHQLSSRFSFLSGLFPSLLVWKGQVGPKRPDRKRRTGTELGFLLFCRVANVRL